MDIALTGIPLNAKALKTWALRWHIGCTIEADLEKVETGEANASRIQIYHKEEGKAILQAYEDDRAGLRLKLIQSID